MDLRPRHQRERIARREDLADRLDPRPGDGRLRSVTPELTQRARELRLNPTPAEAALWEELRDHRCGGLRFRQQHAYGTYIFDFYCPSARLVVELDGAVHDGPDAQAHDALRDEDAERMGMRVLRFRNEQVFTDLYAVLARIRAAGGVEGEG